VHRPWRAARKFPGLDCGVQLGDSAPGDYPQLPVEVVPGHTIFEDDFD